MIHFEGTETFALPLKTVSFALSNAGTLANMLPDAEVGTATEDHATWKVRPKLTFISGTLDTEARVTARVPEVSAKYSIQTKGVGSGSTVEAQLTFTRSDSNTLVHWVGDITALTGLLKLAPKGLIQATAQKVIADVWAAIQIKLNETQGS